MTSQTVLDLVIGVTVLALLIYRQFRARLARARRLDPAAVASGSGGLV
jgi:hypothetical protein